MARFVNIHTHKPSMTAIEPTFTGVHPWSAEDDFSMPDFGRADAVGEIGLDYAVSVDRAKQEKIFRVQLSEAERLRKPVVLHCVKAFEPCMKILGDYSLRAVVFHGWVGSTEQSRRAFEKGYYISFGKRSLISNKARRALVDAPLNMIFLETDDDTGVSIEELYRQVAQLKNVGEDEMKSEMEKSYYDIFR